MTKRNGVLDSLDENDELALKETLMQHRRFIHRHIDSLIRLKTKTSRPLYELA